MKALKIGISACFFHADPQRAVFKGKTLQYVEQSLVHWVMSQGALAFLIPDLAPTKNSNGPSLDDFICELDGLVLQGGSDVAPQSYGEKPLRPEWSGDEIRDRYEMDLVKKFIAADKPILGVCRGMQLLNVALGGSLYQDINFQVPHSLVHRDWNVYDQNFHQIRVVAGTRLAQLYAGSLARTSEGQQVMMGKVNSVHHQGLKVVAKDLVVEAVSAEDNVIEAVRLNSTTRYVFGIQWHPEFQDTNETSLLESAPILSDFLAAVRTRVNQK